MSIIQLIWHSDTYILLLEMDWEPLESLALQKELYTSVFGIEGEENIVTKSIVVHFARIWTTWSKRDKLVMCGSRNIPQGDPTSPIPSGSAHAGDTVVCDLVS